MIFYLYSQKGALLVKPLLQMHFRGAAVAAEPEACQWKWTVRVFFEFWKKKKLCIHGMARLVGV